MASSRRSGAWFRCGLLLVVGALRFRACPLVQTKMSLGMAKPEGVCEQYVCRCPRPESVLKIAPDIKMDVRDMHSFESGSFDAVIDKGLVNLSITDCGKHDPEMRKEMEKQFVDLVTEELKLHAEVSDENRRHMNRTLKKLEGSQLDTKEKQRKCIAATETCEEARERAQASLLNEKKVTALWEKRSRQLGWEGA